MTTRRFSLSGAEWVTTGVAAAVSFTAYAVDGHPYLARGVLGDLAGFLVLSAAGVAVGARVRHEAALCLVGIGAVLLLDPEWPLRMSEPVWWVLFSIGLAAYVVVRRSLTD